MLPTQENTGTRIVLTPSSTHLTSQKAKWINILPPEDKQPRSVRSYYSNLKEDEKVLEEAKMIVNQSQEEEEGGAEKGSKRKAYTRRIRCLQLSVDTAARLTLSANFLLFFLKLAASIQSGSLAVISSLIDSTLDLLSGEIYTCIHACFIIRLHGHLDETDIINSTIGREL